MKTTQHLNAAIAQCAYFLRQFYNDFESRGDWYDRYMEVLQEIVDYTEVSLVQMARHIHSTIGIEL